MLALGIDIGGSGIKGAIVDTKTGRMVTERVRIPTPEHPEAGRVLEILHELIQTLEWKKGPVGVGFPGVIRDSTIMTAMNLHDSLVGIDLKKSMAGFVSGNLRILNDADAAGFAEMRLGAGKPFAKAGKVLLITVGTGIGTVLFSDGLLVPNLEFGHVEFKGRNAERYLSERTRKKEEISWECWGQRLNDYLDYLAFLLQPDLIILGGGGVKKADKFEDQISLETNWGFADFGNRAGIIGAALAATE